MLDELVKQLALERIEKNLFGGESRDLGWGRVYGGQVLGQALSAAAQTVPAERRVHSLHAYFLRPGNTARAIVYDVDRIRDGSSFTTRRVVAIQDGEAIFNLAASFQKEEPGFEHQDAMPDAPAPESLSPDRPLHGERPFEVRSVDPAEPSSTPAPKPPRRLVWLKTAGLLPDDPVVHQSLLAYLSDYALVGTALLPHGVSLGTPGMQVASLDHVMWFHQPFRVDDWLLHVMDSPAAHGARGLVRGQFFSRDGRLVASSSQEGLIRRREP